MQHVEPVPQGLSIHPGQLWSPVIREELVGLLAHSDMGEDGRDLVREQAVAVLGRTLPPTGDGEQRRTGLIVGYVQSGKTLSFTSVIALAHDNDIPVVILFSGTKDNLHRQTHSRLERDLRALRSDGSPWLLFDNPGPTGPAQAEIRTVLEGRMAGPTSNPLIRQFRLERRTLVLTVMKNSTRLGNIRKLVSQLAEQGIDLERVPVLVVDDEADQAGLNTRAGDEEDPSATYAAIRDLRNALPRHSYVQYTATPQAPLLLNLLDTLSPDFVAVLQPGKGYTGGQFFFKDHVDRFVRRISSQEAKAALDDDAPPPTLERALASYLVASLLMGSRAVTQSSMLVHPSHTRDQHAKFDRWVKGLVHTWRELLPKSDDEVRADLVEGVFRPVYDDLIRDLDSPASFEQVVDAIPWALSQVQVRIVNSGGASDSDIEWDRFPFWILVGGNKLDRGYTVEGLVTTYMPRGAGGSQADTIQQRARFFGYKGRYADLCRAWLIPDIADMYERYVEHEEALRKELVAVATQGTPLKTWKRRLLIDSSLKPCRANVIGLPYVRERVKGDSWSRFERLAYPDPALNQQRMAQFLEEYGPAFQPDPRDPRGGHVSQTLPIPLAVLVDDLLSWWDHDPQDAAAFNTTLLLLRARLDDAPDLQAAVYLMDGGHLRRRSLSADPGKINNLFQGRSPQGTDRYPGDEAFHSDDPMTVSVQLHRIAVRVNDKSQPFLTDVPALAVYVPSKLASDVILGLQ